MNLNTERLAKRASSLRIAAITLAENMRNGSFKSLYRGQGIEFSDVREYLSGDNVRSIDWNVTARMGRPFIKQYEEDRELSVFLILDCSLSMRLGSSITRLDAAQEAAALLLLAAEQNSGAIGSVFFDGKIQFSCPPKAGRKNSLMILSKLDKIDSLQKSDGSALSNAITGAAKLLKKRSLVFILSDFRSADWESPFARLAQKHDVVAVRISDPSDMALPEIGTVPFYDIESKKKSIFPTNSRRFKSAWRDADQKRTEQWKDFCAKHGGFPLTLSTEEDAVTVLQRFFKQKARL